MSVTRPAAVALVSVALLASASPANGSSQTNWGSAFHNTSTPWRINQAPDFEVVAPFPNTLDPSQYEYIPWFCYLRVFNGENAVRKAKGRYTIHLVRINKTTGEVQIFEIKAGKWKTKANGEKELQAKILTELFGAGFPSTWYAWVYARAWGTNSKMYTSSDFQCGVGIQSAN